MASHETELYEYEGIQKALEAGGMPLDGGDFFIDKLWAGAHFLRIAETLYYTGLKTADTYADLSDIAKEYLDAIDKLRSKEPMQLDAGALVVRFLSDEQQWSIGYIGKSQMVHLPVSGSGGDVARRITVTLAQGIDDGQVVYGYVNSPSLRSRVARET